ASRGAGHEFDWTHRYGPLDWPRRGTTMMLVSSPHPHYWKAETLDRFDGIRWLHSDAGASSDPSAELPAHRNTRWDERIHFTISGLESNFLIGAGTVYSVDGSQTLLGSGDGTIRVLDGPLGKGSDYSVMTYVPQPTAYDVVKNVQRYLEKGFTYDERPPLRALPLDAFLFRDRIGYCQQFSGAMALLLRMNGIPARVAAGFAPGTPDANTKEYRVRDLDAHSWVEVWFDGIGWVPFDPTPSLSPASAQASGIRLPSAAVGGHDSGKDAGG